MDVARDSERSEELEDGQVRACITVALIARALGDPSDSSGEHERRGRAWTERGEKSRATARARAREREPGRRVQSGGTTVWRCYRRRRRSAILEAAAAAGGSLTASYAPGSSNPRERESSAQCTLSPYYDRVTIVADQTSRFVGYFAELDYGTSSSPRGPI